jgi:hypothetical protein
MLRLLAVWSFGYAMIALVPEMDARRFRLKLENIGIMAVPIVWCAVQYHGLYCRQTMALIGEVLIPSLVNEALYRSKNSGRNRISMSARSHSK